MSLAGTASSIAAPSFLNFAHTPKEVEAENVGEAVLSESQPGGEEADLDLSLTEELAEEESIDLDSEDDADIDFSLEADEEVDLVLDTDEEAGVKSEITMDFAADEVETSAAEDEGLQLDFGEIDISDLAPPAEDADIQPEETLALEKESAPVTEAVVSSADTASLSVAPGSGLEDLQVDGLDLEAPSPLVAGSKAGHKLMPSVKTGTALDDFEFDLGELLEKDK